MPQKLIEILKHEIGWVFSPRMSFMRAIPALAPPGSAGRLRAGIYRLFGARIGRGTMIDGNLSFCSPENIRKNFIIGERCYCNILTHFDLTGPIRIGNRVTIGHHVTIITAHHEIAGGEYRAGSLAPRPVTIGDGAWIAAGVTILPGVSIGEGAVIGAGSLVNRDVPANTFAAGNPAKVIRTLEV